MAGDGRIMVMVVNTTADTLTMNKGANLFLDAQ